MSDIITQEGGALALPSDLMAELMASAKQAAAKERPRVGRISIKSGIMSYEKQPVTGNKMDVVIVGGAYRNTLYKGAYDPDTVKNPDCYALSEEEEGMAPDPGAESPEHPTCKGCRMAEWESVRIFNPTTKRKGKACKQGRRLILLPANATTTDEDAIKSEMAILDVPVTSVKNYSTLVNVLATTINLPVWAVVVTVEVKPHAVNQLEVIFTPVRPISDEKVLRALMKRRDEALRIALTPYEGTGGEKDPDAKPEEAPAAGKKQKF